jgi:hypothetical protein
MVLLSGPAFSQAAIPVITKAFGTSSIPLNGTTTMTFTVTNTDPGDFSQNVTFTDSMPAGLVIATPNGLSQSCSNAGPTTITATAGSSNISFIEPLLSVGGSCTFTVNVTGTTNGLKSNSVVVSSFGGAGNMATATVFVGALTAPAVSQAFGAGTLAIAGTTSLTVSINNPNPTGLTGLAFTDSLPAGLVVATPNALTNTCNGAVSAAAGGSNLSLSGGTLSANGTCTITINVSATTAGTKTNTIGSVTSNEAPAGSAASASLSVSTPGSTTTLTSSLNPSSSGQAVTFTATVTSSGGAPTGTITFLDAGSSIGTGTLKGGVATFTTTTLAVGSHSITASFPGGGGVTGSVSTALVQVVGIPTDSTRLRALQLVATRLEAHASASAFQGAVDGAISDGFSDSGGSLLTSTGSGMRINFGAEPQAELRDTANSQDAAAIARWPLAGSGYQGQSSSNAATGNDRVNNAFGALAYADNPMATKASPLPVQPPREWQFWSDVRGTGWNTDVAAGDITGGQVNALLGLTRRLTPDLLIGVTGGYEAFSYSSTTLNGRLKGDGWTVGGYLGWRIWPGLRFDAALARSGVNYDGVSGSASATFPGSRWIGSAGLTGTYRLARVEIEPSVKVYALWERDNQYVDTLGTLQTAYSFSSGRASGGAKLTYPLSIDPTVRVAPYVGAYADYYFDNGGTVPLLPTQFVQGWSARMIGGLNFDGANGIRGSVGGELGGIGNNFLTWSARGRVSIPLSF